MSRLHIRSYVRLRDGTFTPVEGLERYDGDCERIPGAIAWSVDDSQFLSLDLWDDVNWLWPFVIQALEECRRTGSGERYFPDQPLLFRALALEGSGQLLLSVTGGSIARQVTCSAAEVLEAVAQAGLGFFEELRRICPSTGSPVAEVRILESWLANGRSYES